MDPKLYENEDRALLEQLLLQREDTKARAVGDGAKFMLLLHGGALIALLALAGALIQKEVAMPSGLVRSAYFFMMGLLSAAAINLAWLQTADQNWDDALRDLRRNALPTRRLLNKGYFYVTCLMGLSIGLAFSGFHTGVQGLTELQRRNVTKPAVAAPLHP